MKKTTCSFILLATALVGGLFVAGSCNKGKTNGTKKTEQIITGNLSFDLPVFMKNGQYDSITSFSFMINMDSFVKSFDSKYNVSNIQNVQLRSCILSVENGDVSNNIRNFHMTNIGITSGTNGYINRIATATDIPDTNAYFVSMTPLYEHNLASYFQADSICYRFYANLRRTTTVPLNCKATLSYDMTLQR
jgi:hypothetical protein